MSAEKLHGLIQHSFAMRLPASLDPLYARGGITRKQTLLDSLFAVPAEGRQGFKLGNAAMERLSDHESVQRSRLVSERQTTIEPLSLPLPGNKSAILAWASDGCGEKAEPEPEWRGIVFAEQVASSQAAVDDEGTWRNDFLLEPEDSAALLDGGGWEAARAICQLLAHRRSRLFGLTLARDTFNVSLPYAILDTAAGKSQPAWLALPVVSLSWVRWRHGFRPIFSLSLFLLPVKAADPCGKPIAEQRLTMAELTIKKIVGSVKHSWTLATQVTTGESRYKVRGPLGSYLASAKALSESVQLDFSPAAWVDSRNQNGDQAHLTLRSFAEVVLFGVCLKLARGRRGRLGVASRRKLGDRVLVALSASRVSAVTVVDNSCGKGRNHRCSTSRLNDLLAELSQEIVAPLRTSTRPDFRLDRPYYDRPSYRIRVLPTLRCVLTVGDRCTQDLKQDSALLEAGWIALMVSGAAAATGMIRGVYGDLAAANPSKPEKIADIEREAMVDLFETYDLEITLEAYRQRYRHLRELLGITTEYGALSDKLEALHRETMTRAEVKSEKRLALLSWGIVILSALIFIATVVVIFKGG